MTGNKIADVITITATGGKKKPATNRKILIKKKIKFRPFLVKEEKILLVGKEGSAAEQMNAMLQILRNVVLSPKNFNPMDLTVTDIEYLFMHIRGKSVDNIVKLKYQDKEDEQLYDFEVDINTTTQLSKLKNGNIILVSESGLKDRETLDKLKKCGVDAFLIGESLVTSQNPSKNLRELVGNVK